MSDPILREIDEEVRREQYKQIWKRYQWLIIAVVVLVVGGTAGYRGWEALQSRQAAETGDRFLGAIDSIEAGDVAVGQATLAEIAQSGPAGYQALASLRAAAALAEAGDRDGAVTAYDAFAAGNDGDEALRQIAQVRAARLLLSTASYDEITRRMEPLTAADAPFRHSAREVMLLSAYGSGDFRKAQEWIGVIQGDVAVPANIRSRADLIGAVISGEAGAPAVETQ
ncbi:MAG: tetratricopeptide repeat protein [Pseudomonadota bacterium]